MAYFVDGIKGEFTTLGEALDAAVIPWDWRLSNAKGSTALARRGMGSVTPSPAPTWTLTEVILAVTVTAVGVYLLTKALERRPQRPERAMLPAPR